MPNYQDYPFYPFAHAAVFSLTYPKPHDSAVLSVFQPLSGQVHRPRIYIYHYIASMYLKIVLAT